jgi:uncharacterized protein (DUF427 family)
MWRYWGMSIRLRDVMFRELDQLRHEPTEKRIRGILAGETVVDSTRALLLWEPRRIVATYAVPIEDVHGEIEVAADEEPAELEAIRAPQLGDRAVLDPSVPFSVHTAAGTPLQIRAGGRCAAAFRPQDSALAGVVAVDFAGFDAWYEEDERNYGHPRDPFHRIDIVRSSRHVRVELDGETLAESSQPRLLFEPPLPVRYYLPPEDVRTDLLRPSATRSFCAYKGEASYLSAPEADDIAWHYPAPLREASEVTGCYAFFNEHVDLIVDGARLERPITPWSR